MPHRQQQEPLRVLIAGGGVAAAECALALRALAGDRVRIAMLTPDRSLTYRPPSVAAPFASGDAKRAGFPLAKLAADLGVELIEDSLAWVAPAAHTAFTTGWRGLDYDLLVVATGADRRPAFEHAITFRGDGDADAIRAVLEGIDSGAVHELAFVAPGDTGWTLPLYELALMTAGHARHRGRQVGVRLITPERAPLSIFGEAASIDIARLLRDSGVRFLGSAEPAVTRPGEVTVRPGRPPHEVDAVIALPLVAGRRIRGLRADEQGFLRVTPFGHVIGVKDVYAAGDGTTFPIKQGGVACQQADVVAQVIARRAGADVTPTGHRPVLRGLLLTGDGPRFLRRVDSRHADPESGVAGHTLWWPPSKVAGEYLAPYLGEAFAPEPPNPGVRRRVILTTGRDAGGVELHAVAEG